MALTLHVGAHKTATTHLQQTLRGLRPQLASSGIYYLDAVSLRAPGSRLDAALGTAPAAARRRGVWRRRLTAADETWPEMLVSDENILGSLRREGLFGAAGIYPDAADRLDRLCRVMRRRPAVLCLSVREPVSFLTSAFAMQLQGGIEADFAAFLGGFAPDELSWTGLARRLLAVPGVAGLVAWRHEDYAAARPQILRALVPEALARAAPTPPPAMVGLSQRAYDAIRARRAAWDGDGPAFDLAGAARDAKRRHPRAPGEPPLRLVPADVARQAAAAYAHDVAALERLDGVRLIRP